MAEEPYQQTKSAFMFFSGALIVLPVAFILDIAGFILFFLSLIGIGIPLSFIPDIIGIIVIGPWMIFHSGTVAVPERLQEKAKKAVEKTFKTTAKQTVKTTTKQTGKAFLKLGLTSLGELIPFLGDLMPFWTITVLFELTKG